MTDENWDEAAPVTRPQTDGEEYLIGWCIADEGSTLERVLKKGLTSSDFNEPRNGEIFRALFALRQDGIPIGLDTLSEALGPRINDVGGIVGLMHLADPISLGTSSRVDHHTTSLLRESERRRIIREAQETIERAEKGEMDGIRNKPEGRGPPQRLPSDFSIAPDGDTNVLLGNRYLNRGDGMILVGSSGMGKSSASIQMGVCWSLNRDFHGIRSNGALKVLIIQSEDSDGDVAEVLLSMRHMMKLSEQERVTVDQNMRIVCDRVNRGAEFLNSLKRHLKEFPADLVIINPLQAFMDGDVTESRDLGQFLREGLNGINDSKFGYLLVHHTTKPATGRDKGERQWHEVMYDMAGGAELINWARGVMSLRASETEGDFNLVLAKRGRRAGVTHQVEQGAGTRDEPTTIIPLRHARGSIEVKGRAKPVSIIYWEGREKDQPKSHEKITGREEKYSFNDYRTLFPPHSSEGLPIAQIERNLMPNGPIKKNILHNVLKRWSSQGHIDIIQDYGRANLYRASV